MIDTLVIGGGISGLTLAHELMLMGRDVVLLERQVTVGGNVVSERIGGYLMEHGQRHRRRRGSIVNPAGTG